jgi:hypothetical protein
VRRQASKNQEGNDSWPLAVRIIAMMKPDYYREQAKRARRFALGLTPTTEIAKHLNGTAQDFDELAEDIDTGAVGVRHHELLSAKQRE